MGVLCAILYVFAMYVAMYTLVRKLDTLIWRRTRKREAAKPVQMARTRLATMPTLTTGQRFAVVKRTMERSEIKVVHTSTQRVVCCRRQRVGLRHA
jgi:aspartate ammonia-lyase